MSDEKPKPLAEIQRAREYNHERLHLFVAGRFLVSEPAGTVLGEGEALPKIADEINAAVEQREAKLRGAMDVACRLVMKVLHQFGSFGTAEYQQILKDLSEAATALYGHGDYVPANEAAAMAMQAAELAAKFEGTWPVLFEELRHARAETPLVRALAEALGVKAALPEEWSEEELLRRQMEADRERARRTKLKKAAARQNIGSTVPLPAFTHAPNTPAFQIRAQHLRAVDGVVRHVLDLLPYPAHGRVERHAEQPNGNMLARDTVGVGALQFVIETRMDGNIARTTTVAVPATPEAPPPAAPAR